MPPEPSFRACALETIEAAIAKTLSLTEAVREGGDEEAIHDIRVASRRLRAALSVFEPAFAGKPFRRFRDQVKEITDSLSEARDLDVMRLAVLRHAERLKPSLRPAVLQVAEELAAQRARIQPAVLRSVDRLESADLPSRFREIEAAETRSQSSPDLILEFGLSMGRRLQQLLAWDPFVTDPQNVRELHQMRISAKRLRYTLELLPPGLAPEAPEAVEAVRSLQGLLGEIHDADVLYPAMLAALRKELKQAGAEERGVYMADPARLAGLAAACRQIRAEREARYRDFRTRWDSLKGSGLLTRVIESLYRAASLPAPDEA